MTIFLRPRTEDDKLFELHMERLIDRYSKTEAGRQKTSAIREEAFYAMGSLADKLPSNAFRVAMETTGEEVDKSEQDE